MPPSVLPGIGDYRALVESALAHGDGAMDFEDVAEEVAAGRAQFWPGPRSCIVTQIDDQPRRRILQFFLAAGELAELEAMTPGVLAWGRDEGCTLARLVGRKGWERSFLADTGWTKRESIIMEMAL